MTGAPPAASAAPAATRFAAAGAPWVVPACIWAVALVTLSAPDRRPPTGVAELDLVALVKVAVRGSVILVLAAVIAPSWHDDRARVVRTSLLAFFLFGAWALLSATWSALPGFSLGQAASVVMLLMLALVIGTTCRAAPDLSRMLLHVSAALLVVNLAVLAAHLADPELVSLERAGPTGVIHPTSAGGSAAVGLIVLVGVALLWPWRWGRLLLVPGVLVHAALLYVAAARTALVPTSVALLVTVLLLRGAARATLVAAVSLAAAAYLVCDPALQLVEDGVEGARHYVGRGEPAERLSTLTGRTMLWPRVWSSYLESPVIGHGYFVTSRTGLLPVPEWYQPPRNWTAHNLALQLLASTGVVGAALFAWGVGRAVAAGVRGLRRHPEGRGLGALLALAAVYYGVAALLGETFMGPVQPESVAFFALLGLLLTAVPA